MQTVFKTQGTCAQAILIDIDDTTKVVNNVQFMGGCNGNTSGISSLVRGMKAEDVISKLQGIRCGIKNTSCPDQLATALRQAINK